MSYRARDLLLVPGLLSLARLPLAIVFPFTVDRPWLALLVLAIAGLTDVIDGWYARTFHQVTPTGAVVDPITDKLFVAAVVITLLVIERLSITDFVLLSTREIGEIPLVIWLAISRRSRQARVSRPAANLPGKMATLLQFMAVGSALLETRYTSGLIVATAMTGAVAAVAYWVGILAKPARR